MFSHRSYNSSDADHQYSGTFTFTAFSRHPYPGYYVASIKTYPHATSLGIFGSVGKDWCLTSDIRRLQEASGGRMGCCRRIWGGWKQGMQLQSGSDAEVALHIDCVERRVDDCLHRQSELCLGSPQNFVYDESSLAIHSLSGIQFHQFQLLTMKSCLPDNCCDPCRNIRVCKKKKEDDLNVTSIVVV